MSRIFIELIVDILMFMLGKVIFGKKFEDMVEDLVEDVKLFGRF